MWYVFGGLRFVGGDVGELLRANGTVAVCQPQRTPRGNRHGGHEAQRSKLVVNFSIEIIIKSNHFIIKIITASDHV